MQEPAITIYTDGGSRGNPGPAACAFVANVKNDEFKQSMFLGRQTNNFAEYQGVILALKFLINKYGDNIPSDRIIFFLDSELIARQLTGLYKVKSESLRNLYVEASGLAGKIKSKVYFKNIPREKNETADFLVNQELDNNLKR